MSTARTREVWIGLARVIPGSSTSFLSDYAGAYVNALVLSQGRKDFVTQVRHALENDLNVVVKSVENIEPLQVRQLRGTIEPQIEEIASALTSEHPVDFDDFQFYVE